MKKGQETFSISGRTMHRIVQATRQICEKAGEIPPDHYVVVRAYIKADFIKTQNQHTTNQRKKAKSIAQRKFLRSLAIVMREDNENWFPPK